MGVQLYALARPNAPVIHFHTRVVCKRAKRSGKQVDLDEPAAPELLDEKRIRVICL